ncbi:MAG: M23 family metallopeptidase [Acidimicrobiia bacterium]|nr:M23 family metallopeptidase [Acidimicrobiia bacterium]
MLRSARLVLLGALVLVAVACGPRVTPAPAPAPRPPAPLPGTPSASAPVVTGLVCPVTGAVYTDSYGPRGTGFHWGIDMFEPAGTPVVAVKAGTVRFVANEGGGGNVAYLTGGDANVYQYAHLLDFVGVDRLVTQGAMLGHVGRTGNATANHLHFEIRIANINGVRVDPYPTLRATGC